MQINLNNSKLSDILKHFVLKRQKSSVISYRNDPKLSYVLETNHKDPKLSDIFTPTQNIQISERKMGSPERTMRL